MTNQLLRGLTPVHPGAVSRQDILPALGTSKAAVVHALRI